MDNTLLRNQCPICGSSEYEKLYRIPKFPVFMGTVAAENIDNYHFESITYMVCKYCDCVFIEELIDPTLLYMNNHNTDIVGATWQKHYEDLVNFVLSSIKSGSNILEIGDPSAKVANPCCESDLVAKWKIVEPNQSKKIFHDKIEYLNLWVEDYDYTSYDHDAVVLSHVFEHLFDPASFLLRLSNESKVGTKLILSIPNLKHILDKGLLSPAGLSFEHTFYYDEDILDFLFMSNGWKITKSHNFKNHSIFIKATNTKKSVKPILKTAGDNAKKVLQIFEQTKELVDDLNDSLKISDGLNYIFGAHIQTQFFCSMGLDSSRLVSILDNSSAKLGNKLYGTDLIVKNPEILIDLNNVRTICHMGVYTNEIKAGIIKINDRVKFL